jgi:NAD(P)H-hydrate epimerase
MIPILTLAECKEIERKTAAEQGLSESDMIASAGEAVFESVKALLEEEYGERPAEAGERDLEDEVEDDLGPPPQVPAPRRNPGDLSIAFVCGTGHNGADGLSAAILAAQAGYSVVVYQMAAERGYSRETERLQGQLSDADIAINFVRSPLDLPVFQDISLIVDALLGTGTTREPEGLLQSCIFGMNQSGVPILSVDIPSGLRCDVAEVKGTAVQASATLCLGAMKISSAFYPASLHYGKIGYSPICFDEKLLMSQASRMRLYTLDDAAADYPERDYRANKYSVGKVLVIAGSRGMHGAAALCANAALRAGAGMVKLAYPAGIHSEAAIHILEIIGVPVGAGSSGGTGGAWGVGHFHPEHLAELEPLLEWADSVLVGPGLGKHADTAAFLDRLLPRLKGKRTVLDGDALSWFEPDFQSQADLRGYDTFVLTPHAGEYQRMGGEYRYDQPLDLIKKLRGFAQARNLNLVLKGATTLLAVPDGRVTVLPVGNPGMATAGSGDVLAGTIAGILGVKEPEQAAALGAYAHGKAGDLARKDRGTLGLVASDLLLYLPLALLDAEEGGEEESGEWLSE